MEDVRLNAINMLKEYSVCPMIANLSVSAPSIEFKGALNLKNYPPYSEEVDIHEACHCDGLLLCTTMDYRIVVWNPCLGETRWIRWPKNIYSRFALGYEKNKYGRIYKILRCWDRHNSPTGRVDEFEIYEFSSDSWRVLDLVALDCHIASHIGVSFKGNTYWLASDKKDKYGLLLCFDFTTERFTRLCLPPSQDVSKMALSVVGGKQLSLLSQSDSTSKIMEMWVTNIIEDVLMWSKSFTVDIPIRGDYCPYLTSYLVDEEKKVAVCYNENFEKSNKKVYIIGEDNGYYTEIPLVESSYQVWGYPIIFNYVPSLVQIEEGGCIIKE